MGHRASNQRETRDQALERGRSMRAGRRGGIKMPPQMVGLVIERPEKVALPESPWYILLTGIAGGRHRELQERWRGVKFRVRVDHERQIDRLAVIESTKYHGEIGKFDPVALWGHFRGNELVVDHGYNLRLDCDITVFTHVDIPWIGFK